MFQNIDIDRNQLIRLQSIDVFSAKKQKDGIIYDLETIRKVLNGEEHFRTPPNEHSLNTTFNLDDSFLQSNTKELDKINIILREKLADDRRLTNEYDNLKMFMDSVQSIFHISSNDIQEVLNVVKTFSEQYSVQQQSLLKLQNEISDRDKTIEVLTKENGNLINALQNTFREQKDNQKITVDQVKNMFEKTEEILKKKVIMDKITFDCHSKKLIVEYDFKDEYKNILDDDDQMKLLNATKLFRNLINSCIESLSEYTKFTQDMVNFLSPFSGDLNKIKQIIESLSIDYEKAQNLLKPAKSDDTSKDEGSVKKSIDDLIHIKDLWQNAINFKGTLKTILFPAFTKFKEIISSQQRLLLSDLGKKR